MISEPHSEAHLTLSVPDVALCTNHLIIEPVSHVSSMLRLDSDAWAELTRLKACIRTLYQSHYPNLSPLFIECAVRSGDTRSHARMDVIPLTNDQRCDAPMAFEHACVEAAGDWSSHKKPIKLAPVDAEGKSVDHLIRAAIPSHFDYISAEWDKGALIQVAHEDSSLEDPGGSADDSPWGLGTGGGSTGSGFSPEFGLEVVAGLIEVDPFLIKRRRGGEEKSSDVSKRTAAALRDIYAAFDFSVE